MKRLLLALIIFLSTFIVSCGSNSDNSDNPNDSTIPNIFSIPTSVIQKGPFVSGSSITIQTLDDNFNSTGSNYTTQTQNDFGEFSLGSVIDSNIVEVIAKGYYFNEVSGSLSSGELTLRAIVDLEATDKVNVNILTTLSKERIVYLVTVEGKSFNDAKVQAEEEVLNIFNIPIYNDITSFENMDISQNNESNAILLAISVILQQNSTVAELSELISKINLDLKEDGILNNTLTITQLKENSKLFNQDKISSVITNVVTRYSNLGIDVSIPNFGDFIDSDGNGIINKNDKLVVLTTLPTDITGKTAKSGSSILSHIGKSITSRGVCWSINTNPTIDNQKTTDDVGFNPSVSSISGLSLNTTYYIRAYVVDTDGTTYGNELSFTTNSTYTIIVDTGPSGGWIFYDKGFYSNGWRYLEAAIENQSNGCTWSNITSATVGTSTEIGSGQTNTTAIISQSGHTNSAAKLCDDYSVVNNDVTYNDWFLPSKDELNLMYMNLSSKGFGNFPTSTYQMYWSSSEDIANPAEYVWNQRLFDNGNPPGDQWSYNKYGDFLQVRAIRAF